MQLSHLQRLLLLTLLLLAGCSGRAAPIPTPVPAGAEPAQTTYSVQRGTVSCALSFTARVAPVQQADLFFRADGYLGRLLVQRDDLVQERDLLAEWAGHRPYELSGGQQQRIAIARALVHHPVLILADEPTGELDSATAREIFALLQRLAVEQGVTAIVASHDPLVSEYAAWSVRLQDGRIEPA